MFLTVLKMAKQWVYGARGHSFLGAHLIGGGQSPPGPITGYGPN